MAASGNQCTLVHSLIEASAQVDAKDADGRTPLIAALEGGFADVTKLLIENGADIISIQKMMGHENVVTTEKYLHVNKKHLVETMIKFHPRK